MTGRVCETLGRDWIIAETKEEYLRGSLLRFTGDGEELFATTELVSVRPDLDLKDLPEALRSLQTKGRRTKRGSRSM